ncbi:MAG: hypothetical protein E2586_04225 [Novosphingobium sp.]|uniref:hypothetical protein n=1 Tax=Novosphingobium sp. TaxID=1874826 RepID=UPI0012C3C8F8|nr:hypothetical protein [Novosphingobium sp.]MPS67687.1 hypothetical protein [Novosphingobium sp.]
MNDVQIAKMLEFVARCADAKKLRQIAINADEKSVSTLAQAARLKLYSILPNDDPGTIEYAVWQSIYALEDVLKQERGKTILLSRTRQKIGRQGVVACVADLVLGKASDGFKMLEDRQMLKLSFEAIALQFPGKFDDRVLDAAKRRLGESDYEMK